MVITRAILKQMLLTAAADLKEQCPRLSEIDSRFGDGDHGVTINKIALLIESQANAWADTQSIKALLEALGDGIMAVGGGSAGPLYGTLIGGLALPLDEQTEIDADLLKQMLVSCRDEMFDISTARVGDKTMMDALIPAVDAAVAAAGDPVQVLEAAATAGEAGAKSSEQFMSKFGRAKSYKEQTIGTPDAGAVSTSVLLRGLARSCAPLNGARA